MLEERGFLDSDISLLMSDSVGEDFKIKDSSKMPEGLAAGAGGIVGGLAGARMTEHEAKLFASELEDGRILVAVHCSSDARKETAEEVFEATSGVVSVE
jgi:hypothetical protein